MTTNEVLDEEHANEQSAQQEDSETEEDGPGIAKTRLPARS
jgi:hypothetical protein